MLIIRIKENSTAHWDHFALMDPKVCMIFFDAVFFLQRHGIKELTITSMIRPKSEDDSGIHADGRAIDLRADMAQDIIADLVSYINNKYPYDQMRPGMRTCVYHEGAGYGGDKALHFHFQVKGNRGLVP